ncbi:transposase [Allobacillus sp. SKP2-8]|uniref:transposase n=1 Tax=Allobacillus sp. SKP2-8 TaxID=1955271 RepID=UPI00351BA742
MSQRSYSDEFKIEVVQSSDSRNCSVVDYCSYNGISESTLKRWLHKFETEGVEGLRESKTWNRYSQELKLQAVKDYESGKYSLSEVVYHYNISSSTVLRKWSRKMY